MRLNRYRCLFGRYCRISGKILLVLVIFLSGILPGYSQGRGYEYLMELGRKFFNEGNYAEAMHYFRLVQLADPDFKEAGDYINLIKQKIEGRVVLPEEIVELEKEVLLRKKIEELKSQESAGDARREKIEDALNAYDRELRKFEERKEERELARLENIEKNLPKEQKIEGEARQKKIENTLDSYAEKLRKFEETGKEKDLMPLEKIDLKVTPLSREDIKVKKEKIKKEVFSEAPVEIAAQGKELILEKKVVDLAMEIKEKFPLTVEIHPDESFFVSSPHAIKRFLAVSPDFISVEKIDASSLKIRGNKIGLTFFHVWDEAGRWTFNVKITPRRRSAYAAEEKAMWEDVKGFRMNYSSAWRSYYQGRRVNTLERKSIGFGQSASMFGPTPYGNLGASMSWSKLKEKHELTGYSAGLTQGKLGDFKDFSLRGFDISKSFSSLSLSGKTLHGVLFESPAFNKQIKYTLLYGKERPAYYGFISPGILAEQDAYVQGMRLELFPQGNNQFSFNLAEAGGPDREDYLKDRVFSLQGGHSAGKLSFSSEIATDEDSFAGILYGQYRFPKSDLGVSFYNVEKDFVTITGRPSNSGRIGGSVVNGWRPLERVSLNSGLNVYQDRVFFNPDNPEKLNFDWTGLLDYYIDSTSSLSNNIYYTNTSGLLFPQRSLSTRSTYNKRFDFTFFGERYFGTYLGYSYFRNTNPLSPTSDYRRDGLLSGLRLQLVKDLSAYFSYSYSQVENIASGDCAYPSVMETGINFYRSFAPGFFSNVRFSYRNEEKSESRYSFLAGQDSLEGSLSLTYKPNKDMEFFIDGNIRNVWSEKENNEKYMDGNIKLGTRLSWDSFLKWAPKTRIEGSVFRDVNANGVRDSGEEGLAGVKVMIGPKRAISNEDGRFAAVVRTKKLVANIDLGTVPEGYILTTLSSLDVDTSCGGVKRVDFGLSIQSGIYGVVFYDVNDNGELDKNDVSIQRAKIILDRNKSTITNSQGVYFFSDISVGPHLIQIDVNSLPLEYLPKISIKKEIDVSQGVTVTHHIPLRKKKD